MPYGPGTYGKQVGRPKKKVKALKKRKLKPAKGKRMQRKK
jgi:hypothetical protein